MTNPVAANTDVGCVTCYDGYFKVGSADPYTCTACTHASCTACTAVSTCTKCSGLFVAGNNTCNASVAECKTDTTTVYNTWSGTAATCEECKTSGTGGAYFIKKADKTSCLTCASITNCKTYVAVDSSCGCSECLTAGYYYLTGTGA